MSTRLAHGTLYLLTRRVLCPCLVRGSGTMCKSRSSVLIITLNIVYLVSDRSCLAGEARVQSRSPRPVASPVSALCTHCS